MSKRFLEDMVQAKRQKIKIEENGRKIREIKKEPQKVFVKETQEKEEVREVREVKINNIKGRSRYMLWFVALVSVLFCFFAFSFLFSKAEIMVNPKTEDVVLNENFSAIKDSNTDSLSFQLIPISGEETKTVQGEEKNVSLKAKGVVVIYNTFSSSSQSLNIDTRLEGSNGKIYKTEVKTVVPGRNKDGTPGKVEVGIYGSEAGADYNSVPLDFKIFGFKGTSKYSKIYARSKGDIAGGLKGKFGQISDTEKETVVNDLKTALQEKLFKKATDQIPGEFILFKDAVLFNIDNETVNFTPTGGQVSVGIKGTFYGFFFNEKELTNKIVMSNVEKYDKSEVYIPNIRDLTFSLSNKNNVSLGNMTNIDFNLSGPVKIVWKLDINKFIADLLGKSKNDFNQMLEKYPNISSATLTLNPLWRMSIPDKTKDIKIIVNYPK